MDVLLDLTDGVAWSVVYVMSIVLGIKHKTWCLPKIAICQNFAWEFWIVMSQILSGAAMRIGYAVQIAWLILDIAILFIWLWFDRKAIGINIFLVLLYMAVIFFLGYQEKQWTNLAFAINAIMSALFLLRFYKKPGNWISPTIAIAKLTGTFAATILEWYFHSNIVALWLGGLCLIFDAYYCILVINDSSKGG